MIQFNTIPEALEDLRQGKLILVTDDPDRENEGDFICAAEFATTENVNFMATHGKGLICMPMSECYVPKAGFAPDGSAATRTTMRRPSPSPSTMCPPPPASPPPSAPSLPWPACRRSAKPEDFRRPGHMFPLLAKRNGVLERNGHTEATVDLCRLAGLTRVRPVLRDHAGGRHHDAYPRAGGAGQTVRHQVRHHPGFAELSQDAMKSW